MSFSRYRLLLLLALFLEAGFLSIFALGDLSDKVVEFVALYLLISVFYIAACYVIATTSASETARKYGLRRYLILIWAAGIAFRVTLLPLSPTLSEDLNRYRWQGKLQAAGGNPYIEIPADPRWESLRDRTWPHVNRKDLPSVYGPLLELSYAGYYKLVNAIEPDEIRQVWMFKLPYAALELATGAAMMALLTAAHVPQTWLLIYLWSPLMIVEFWAQGHNDSLAALCVVLALTAAYRERWVWASIALALATLAKFWPLALFPFLLVRRHDKRWIVRWKAALAAIPVALAVSWPYLDGIANVTVLLRGFVGGWRNNDSLYGLIYALANWDFERGTTLVTWILVISLVALWSLQLPFAKASKWAVVLILFLSANCFPWYLSWLIPFLALFPGPPLLLWTALVVLSYQVLIGYAALGIWQDSGTMRLLEYLPVYGLLGAGFFLRHARRILSDGRRASHEPR